MMRPALAAIAATAIACCAAPGAAFAFSPVPGTTCPTFPDNSWWHADISKLPVHARSAQWMSHMSPGSKLHPDFGPSYGEQPAPYGIPITVVAGSHAKVTVQFDIDDESDHVGYPLGNDTKVEGGQYTSGDRHTVVVDRDTCRLYETWATRRVGAKWRAGSGATWDLRSNALRPRDWTSGDAAGLPILPGLLRWNEVRTDRIDHAIRFTTDETSNHHLWPARHHAGSTDDLDYPPMGARFRLRSTFDASGLSPYAQRVVAAMKKYGLVLADNGSPWYFQGEQHGKWPDQLIEDLKQIPADQFVAVDTSSLQVSPDSAQVK